MYLISAYFDQNSNKTLQRYINTIARETGNDFMTSHHVPPHMTLLSVEARSVEELILPFESLRDRVNRGDVQFVTIGQLLPYVMYASPVLNKYLYQLQTSVFEVVKDLPKTSISRFYQPYSWLPHVTLGKTLDQKQMREAFCCMQEQFSPFSSTVVEIGLAKVNPHEDVVRFQLQE